MGLTRVLEDSNLKYIFKSHVQKEIKLKPLNRKTSSTRASTIVWDPALRNLAEEYIYRRLYFSVHTNVHHEGHVKTTMGNR